MTFYKFGSPGMIQEMGHSPESACFMPFSYAMVSPCINFSSLLLSSTVLVGSLIILSLVLVLGVSILSPIVLV